MSLLGSSLASLPRAGQLSEPGTDLSIVSVAAARTGRCGRRRQPEREGAKCCDGSLAFW
jgi:hypothetical protein